MTALCLVSDIWPWLHCVTLMFWGEWQRKVWREAINSTTCQSSCIQHPHIIISIKFNVCISYMFFLVWELKQPVCFSMYLLRAVEPRLLFWGVWQIIWSDMIYQINQGLCSCVETDLILSTENMLERPLYFCDLRPVFRKHTGCLCT